MIDIQIKSRILRLYEKWAKQPADRFYELLESGSNRRYFRLGSADRTVIATFNEEPDENKAFQYLSDHLLKHGVQVPQVYSTEDDIYLQQDLGTTNLHDFVLKKKASGQLEVIELYYKKVIDQMPLIQIESAADMNFSLCFPRQAFDAQSVQWDLNYFKYHFLKTTYIPFHEQKLENDFQTLIQFLMEAPNKYFLFRDFQSRNIMIHQDDVFFIDYQGGRKGALQYDLASLLFESKTELPALFRRKMLDYYCQVFSKYSFFCEKEFRKYFPAFVLVRMLQAFGAYGYRGLFERKALFVKSIAPGVDNLLELLEDYDLGVELPHLIEVIRSMKMLKEKYQVPPDDEQLTITIHSFSYKKGLPVDYTGNGGGYIFDCRALPNPGRYPQYQQSTGLDQDVIDFLKKERAVKDFIEQIQILIASTVNNYQQRGFSHLQINFGCTGGQHRSVYSAEQMKDFLTRYFHVKVHLIHRELKKEEWYVKNTL